MANMLKASDREFIRDYVADAPTDAEKQARRREVAESFGVSLQAVAAITAWTKIRAQRAGSPVIDKDKPENVRDVQVTDGRGEEAPMHADLRRETISEGGEHFDYDNEVKRIWREKLRVFVNENTNASTRERMRILCLPGKKCLEIPMYTELGFMPKNIIGVEGGDTSARAEFAANAEKYGIDGRTGRLEDILQTEDKPFDVVSLDFLGPLCLGYEDILKKLYLTNRAVLMVNVMAQREGKQMQFLMKSADLHKRLIAEKRESIIIDPYDSEFEASVNDSSLNKSREYAYVTQILANVGFDRAENLRFGDILAPDDLIRKMCDDFREEMGVEAPPHCVKNMHQWIFYRYMINAQEGLHSFLKRAFGRKTHLLKESIRKMASYPTHLAFNALYGRPLPMENRRYGYISMAGNRPLQFHSEFMVLDFNRDVFSDSRRTIAFALSVASYLMQTALKHEKGGRYAFRYRRGKIGPHYLDPTNILIFLDSHNKTIAEVPMQTLIADCNRYLDSRNKSIEPSDKFFQTKKEMISSPINQEPIESSA